METLCRFYLLGRVEVARPGFAPGRLKRFPLRDYLALRLGETVTRDEIITALWPDKPSETVRPFLNSTLHHLRKQLEPTGIPSGATLLADDQTISLNPDTVQADAADFLRLLAAAERSSDRSRRRERLEQAVALYKGPLLPGYHDEWAHTARLIYEGAFLEAACELLPLYVGQGQERAAVELAQQTLRTDALCAEAHAALLQTLGPHKSAFAAQWRRTQNAFGRAGIALPASLLPFGKARGQMTVRAETLSADKAENPSDAEFLAAFSQQSPEKQRAQAEQEADRLCAALEFEFDALCHPLQKADETHRKITFASLFALLDRVAPFHEKEQLVETRYRLWERLYQIMAGISPDAHRPERLIIGLNLANQAMMHGNNRRLRFWQAELEREGPRWLPPLPDVALTQTAESVAAVRQYAEFHQRCGANAHNLGQNDKARRHFERAMQLLPDLPPDEAEDREIAIRAHYGYALQFAGEYAEARQSLERAYALLKKRHAKNPADAVSATASAAALAERLYCLAVDDCRTGNFDDALQRLNDALLLYADLPQTENVEHGVADCRRQIGALYATQGFYGIAKSASSAAEIMYARLNKPHSRAAVAILTGHIFLSQGRRAEAETHFQNALAFWRDQQNHSRWTGIALTGLAEARLQGFRPDAENLASEALRRFAEAPSPLSKASALLVYGAAARRRCAYSLASNAFRECLVIRQKAENWPHLPGIWEEIAALLNEGRTELTVIRFFLEAAFRERCRLRVPLSPAQKTAMGALYAAVDVSTDSVEKPEGDAIDSGVVTAKALSLLAEGGRPTLR